MFLAVDYKLGLGDLILRAAGRFYYLASPYTHEDQKVVEDRVEEAHEYYAAFTAFGLHIYNAIYESHRAARAHKLPTHFTFWKEQNSAFIRPSAGIIVAEIVGWDESKGVKSEIDEARSLGLPVYASYYHPTSKILFIREMYSENTAARAEAD